MSCKIDEKLDVKTDSNGCVIAQTCIKLSNCPATFDPVCADGKTYTNACEAKAAGKIPSSNKGGCGTTSNCPNDFNTVGPDISTCKKSGKSYTFDSDSKGCAVSGTVKCVELSTKCPTNIAGPDASKKYCEQSGGVFESQPDPLGCSQYRCKYPTEDFERCKTITDPKTGVSKIECPKEDLFCPPLPEKKDLDFMETKCKEYGGKFSINSEFGCSFPDCKHGTDGFEHDNPFEKMNCPTNLDLEKKARSCEALGQKARFMYAGQCKKVVCSTDSQEECKIDPDKEKEIENKCQEAGKVPVKKFNANGCQYTTCAETKTECDKDAPATVASKCAAKGGEYVINKDETGCVEFAECIEPGLSSDDVSFEPVVSVPDVLTLLDVALKLEDLKVALDMMQQKVLDLGLYYESLGNSQEKEKFNTVGKMLETAKTKVDEIKETMKEKLEKVTVDELTDIKKDLAILKDSLLKEILYKLLSTKEEATTVELVDCKDDNECFGKRFLSCSPATFTPQVSEGKSAPQVKLEGITDGKCVMSASVTSSGKDYDMKCQFENFGLGELEQDSFLNSCTGTMVDLLKEGYFDDDQTSTSAPSAPSGQLIAKELATVDNPATVGMERLAHDNLGNGQYRFSVYDQDGLNSVTIKKSSGTLVSYVESAACSSEFKSSNLVQVSKSDFPLTASVNDCRNPTLTHQITVQMPG